MPALKEVTAIPVVHDRRLEKLMTTLRIETAPKPPAKVELRRIPQREPYAFD